MDRVLDISTLRNLAELDDIVRNNRRVYLLRGDDRLDMVARAYVVSEHNMGFLSTGEDVRDACVWFSGTFEHVIPVADLLDVMADGLMMAEYR